MRLKNTQFFKRTMVVGMMASLAPFIQAADHLDGPAAKADAAADITDIYAWMNDTNKMNLIMNVTPVAGASSKFSDAVQYVFHVNGSTGYGATQTESIIVCTFNVSQKATCKLNGKTLVRDVDASSTDGVDSVDSKFKVFAGLRKDPFFFDLDNFNLARTTVRDAASSLTFDNAGCPSLDNTTRAALVSTVTGTIGGVSGTHVPGTDFFGSLNVLSIVVQVDKSLLKSGPVYGVWGSTHRN